MTTSDTIFSPDLSKEILTTEWFDSVLEEPCWRFKLLGKFIEFINHNFESIEGIGEDYIIRLSKNVDKSELECFLSIVSLLTSSHPQIIIESSSLLILLARP